MNFVEASATCWFMLSPEDQLLTCFQKKKIIIFSISYSNRDSMSFLGVLVLSKGN